MFDNFLAEGLAHKRATPKGVDRVPQRMRNPWQGFGHITVAFEERARVRLIFDPVQRCRDHACVREVRVRVATGDPTFDAQRRSVADHPKANGTVVVAPRDPRRRKRTFHVPLVGIHVGCEQERERARMLQQTPDSVAKCVRWVRVGSRDGLALLVGVAKHRAAFGVGEAHVDVKTVSGVLRVPLRHEGNRRIATRGDLLRGEFVNNVSIRHFDCRAIAKVDLMLARARFAFAEFDGDPARVCTAANRSNDVFRHAP